MTRAMIMAASAATVLGIIRDLFLRNFTRDESYNHLRPLVASQSAPFVFKTNTGAGRIPKPMDEQYQMLRDQIGRIYSALENDPHGLPSESDSENEPEQVESEDVAETPVPVVIEPESERPVKKNRETETEQAERFYAEFLRLRDFCETRGQSEKLDSLSYRPLTAANRLLKVGFPVEGLLSQMCLTWPDDAKREGRVPNFNMERYSREVMASEGISEITRKNGRVETPHSLFGAFLTFARAGQPIWLIGPHGTGKSHGVKQVAEYMGRSYGEAPMSNGASRGDLLGRHTIGGLAETLSTASLASLAAMPGRRFPEGENPLDIFTLLQSLERISENGAGGFVTSEFESAYGNGGFFCFEELDAADAGMLLVVNNALESDELFNPINGRVIKRHPDFVAAASGNTPGLGATRDYNTRERLDASTLDRWRMGRFFVMPDAKVERAILFNGLGN